MPLDGVLLYDDDPEGMASVVDTIRQEYDEEIHVEDDPVRYVALLREQNGSSHGFALIDLHDPRFADLAELKDRADWKLVDGFTNTSGGKRTGLVLLREVILPLISSDMIATKNIAIISSHPEDLEAARQEYEADQEYPDVRVVFLQKPRFVGDDASKALLEFVGETLWMIAQDVSERVRAEQIAGAADPDVARKLRVVWGLSTVEMAQCMSFVSVEDYLAFEGGTLNPTTNHWKLHLFYLSCIDTAMHQGITGLDEEERDRLVRDKLGLERVSLNGQSYFDILKTGRIDSAAGVLDAITNPGEW